jgi:hypothetical protein
MTIRKRVCFARFEALFFVYNALKMAHHIKDIAMFLSLHHWIFIGSNAYDEYVFVPWLNRNVYLRTVDLNRVCLQ